MDAGDHEYTEGSRCMKEGKYVEAVHFFSKAIFLCPNEPLPYISRAEAFVCLCDVRSAIANYRRALAIMEASPTTADLRRRLSQLLDSAGLVAYASGNTTAALKLSEEAISECPHPLASLHHAIYLVAVERYGQAESILRSVLETDPDEVQPEASTLLARLLIATRRDFGSAKALIEEMATQYPNNKSTMQAQAFFTAAFDRFRQNAERSLDSAALTKAIEAYPDDASLYYIRAVAYCEAKTYTLAVQDLFLCINKSDGTHPQAATMMARVLATIGDDLSTNNDFSSAIHYYTESLKWCGNTPDTEVLLARGDCHNLLNKSDLALDDYKRVHDLDPLHEGARSRLGQLHDSNGSTLYNEGNYLLAEVEFTKALEYFDQNPAFFFHRALTRGMLGKGAMMVRDLMSCRELGTNDPQMVSMIQQFCLESTAAESKHMKDSTNEALRLETDLAKIRAETSVLRNKERREKRPKENDFQLSSMRSQGKDVLEGGVLTPANIRHFVRNMQVSKATAVTVQNNVFTNQRTINGRDAGLVEKEERQRPHWAISQKKAPSRLDAINVSKPTPPPKLYRYVPQNPPTHSVEMDRYKRTDESMFKPTPVAPASAQRKGPLAPMISQVSTDIALAPFISASKAPRATFPQLPKKA